MKKALIFLIVGIMLFSPLYVITAQPEVPREGIWEDPDDIIEFLEAMLGWVYAIVGILVVAMILYAGFMFLTASGDEEKFKTAKKSLTYALIGVAVILLAWGIVSLIRGFLAY